MWLLCSLQQVYHKLAAELLRFKQQMVVGRQTDISDLINVDFYFEFLHNKF